MSSPESGPNSEPRGSVLEVFLTFLKLGSTSFGGPIAHLGYYHRELVEKRRWVSESEYAQLLGLCQFLPGPASSQLGFSLGLARAGWGGALAAFTGFTLPSAMLMIAFALALPRIGGTVGVAALHGLALVALAVVARGVFSMAERLCPDPTRATIATLAAVLILVTEPAWMQLVVVALGALAGLAFCRVEKASSADALEGLTRNTSLGWLLLGLFGVGLTVVLVLGSRATGLFEVAAVFYRAGALVFGGGHVVLPLLEESVVGPGWITPSEFLAGYGAAQAVPGPMFTFSAYLGARLPDPNGGVLGGLVALVAIFLPGFLLVSGILPMWSAVVRRPGAARAVAGVNAAVVGLLGAALYAPVWTKAVRAPVDVAIAVVGFTLLSAWRVSAILVVVWCVAASIAWALWL